MDLVENLLPGVDPVGKEIRWNNVPCQVIGVGKKEGSSLGTSLDNWIILPLTNLSQGLRIAKRFAAHQRRAPVPHRAFRKAVDEVRQIMRGAIIFPTV